MDDPGGPCKPWLRILDFILRVSHRDKCFLNFYLFYFLLEYNCFTMLCYCLLDNDVNEPFVVQSLSRVQLFVPPWTAARQASLSSVSQSLLTLMSTESVMPYNHLFLCHPLFLLPQSFPVWESFPMSQLFESSGQIIGASASASILPMNIQGWFPLGLLVWSPCCPTTLKSLPSTTVQKNQSTICIHISPSSWTSLPLPPPTPLGLHRTPSLLCFIADSY